ncbi:GNAT family N-acetyltransferase [Clostridium manihotivorum]|uniref:GNAT family N-acetyltransferase n=1 Tax=Clostridium manihotivorum TaxID=2320868 RepID=A0A3R5QTP4_9CLOT|nr:GNAT family N-acetyltransferase [Clostridium manihotivorum]QAA32366.1 GNAT family N-acetyltransferase [Clostridium manihotivorum]
MQLDIKKINLENVKQITKWVYEAPYSIYSMDKSEECVRELLKGDYYTVFDSENNIIGYCCFGEDAQVPIGNIFGAYDCKDYTDVGLGMKPDLCGCGLGVGFLKAILDFAKDEFAAKAFRLTVADFNSRAVKVYERTGFKKVSSFERSSKFGNIGFSVMILD